jgi:hypothetical protein
MSDLSELEASLRAPSGATRATNGEDGKVYMLGDTELIEVRRVPGPPVSLVPQITAL